MKKAKKNNKKKAVKAVKKSAAHSAAKTRKNTIGVMPLGDRVLVKPLSAEESATATTFGILIPDTAKEKPEQGTVVAVGPGRRNEKGERVPLEVKVGDHVYFKKPWDEPMKVNGVEYYVIAESDITLIRN